MLRLGLFLLVTLMLQSTWCTSDEIQDDEESEVPRSHEVVDSFSRNYDVTQYPWRLWNFPYYQPRIPQSPTGENSPPLADPRFVTNRCNSWQSYTTTTTYPCYTTVYTTTITYVTSTTVTTTIYPTTPYPTTTPTTPYTETTTTGYPSTTTAPPIVPFDCGRSKFMSPARIMGGSEATPNEFPWMVRFLIQNTTTREFSTCGGTLVSDKHVITAPHCFYDSFVPAAIFPVNILNITVGAHNLSADSSDQFRQFANWQSITTSHPGITPSTPIDNFISVVTLDKPLIINDYVRPACLPFENDSDQVNDTVVLTGWGAYMGSPDASPVLRKTVTTVVSSNETNGQCQHGPGNFSSDTFICGDGSHQRRYCKGDDGGPMNFYHKECDRWFVVGVAGRGDSSVDCQNSNKPSVYTRVSNQNYFSSWTGAVSPVDCQQASNIGTVLNIANSEQMTIVSTIKQPDGTTFTTITNPNIIAL